MLIKHFGGKNDETFVSTSLLYCMIQTLITLAPNRKDLNSFSRDLGNNARNYGNQYGTKESRPKSRNCHIGA
ncbi:hypothetical protein GM51_9965 [freshwater metagenome]|jgi:hypothetical protein|uniref:Uncharacterized protein n=1 Tax=freshwater metagenome TaxID=449393 RepID=A0A094SH26_9ZZZZ